MEELIKTIKNIGEEATQLAKIINYQPDNLSLLELHTLLYKLRETGAKICQQKQSEDTVMGLEAHTAP